MNDSRRPGATHPSHLYAWVAAFSVGLASTPAWAASELNLGFTNISGNNATNAQTGETQLSLTVRDLMNGNIEFVLSNSGPLASSITDAYWDDADPGLLADLISIDNTVSGVNFAEGGAPPNLPAGNNATPSFSADFLATATNPSGGPNGNGVNPSESVGITFELAPNIVFDDIDDALSSGALRVGIHVQSFANGGSESFINDTPDTPIVPTPSAALGGLAMLGVLGGARRRRSGK